LAVQWGPIADAGVLAGDAAARQRLEDSGAPPLAVARALDTLETALAGRRAGDAVLALAPLRWGRLAAELPLLSGPLFERVDTSGDGAARPEALADLRESLAGLDDTVAQRRLVELFRAEAAAILRLDPAEIDPGRPMADLGFDSLMAVELKLSAEQRHGIVLPVFALTEGATLATLATRVLVDLRRGEVPSEEEDLAAALVARHAGAGQAGIVARLRGADGDGP
jgi:acyl carrier protein